MSDRFELRVRGSMVDKDGEVIAVDSLQDGTAVAAFVVDDEGVTHGRIYGGMSAANMAGILYSIHKVIGEDGFCMALELLSRVLAREEHAGEVEE